MEGVDKEDPVLEDKLTKLRRKQGLSQQDVADALGVTRQTVSNWECGQGAPALDKARGLARLYHVSLDDLVSDEVEVVAAPKATEKKDLHVLQGLKGATCQMDVLEAGSMALAFDEWGRQKTMRVLDVSEDWLRVEYERAHGVGKKETIVQLLDVDAVGAFTIMEDDAS